MAAFTWHLYFRSGVFVTLVPQYPDHAPDDVQKQEVLRKSAEVLSKRLAGIGITDPALSTSTGDLRISLPPTVDTARLKTLIQAQGKLEFRVFEKMDYAELLLSKLDSALKVNTNQSFISHLRFFGDRWPRVADDAHCPIYRVYESDQELVSNWLRLPSLSRLIPVDMRFVWDPFPVGISGSGNARMLYLIKSKVQFIDRLMSNIVVNENSENAYPRTMTFEIPGDAAYRFDKIIRDQGSSRWVMQIDDKVIPITTMTQTRLGCGSIEFEHVSISRGDAQDLKILLQSGAMPVVFNVEEFTVRR
ncbi:MAG: hypothetical protein GY867_01955 [bacterium]|nr:hypothetical protein [bacterium]